MSKPKPAPLPSGTVVGGYQIVKKLAAGGFGVAGPTAASNRLPCGGGSSCLSIKNLINPSAETGFFEGFGDHSADIGTTHLIHLPRQQS